MELPQSRVFYLDACRAAFMLLGIVLHAAVPFVPDAHWLVSGDDEAMGLGYLTYFIGAFRMPGFFIIAGYFAARMIARDGARQWLGTRFERLAVPLVFAMLVVVPLNSFAVALPVFADTAAGGFGRYVAGALKAHLQPGFHWLAHMWFVLDLLIFCILFAAASAVFGRGMAQGARRIAHRVTLRPALLGSALIGLLAVYLVGVVVLSQSQAGAALAFVGDYPLWHVIDGPRLFYYAPFFLLGVALFHGDGMMDAFARPSRVVWLAGLMVTLAHIYLRAHVPHRELLATALAAPAAILLARMWMDGARITFDRPSRMIRHAVDASYTVYIVHHPIIIVGVALAMVLQLGVYTSFAAVMLFTSVVSVGIHLATRNRPFWRYVLNGLKPRVDRPRSGGRRSALGDRPAAEQT